jgi:hypothetical protein
MGADEAAEFDAAARQAYQAALKLETGSPLAPASPPSRPADAPEPVPEPLATAAVDAPTWAALTGPQSQPSDRPASPVLARPDLAGAAQSRQLGDTAAPHSLLRTPSTVTPVADEFFDSLIRRVESDR